MTALRLRLHTRSALRLRVVPVYGAAVSVAADRDSSAASAAAAAASAAAALAGANDAASSAAAAAASAAAVPRMRYGAGAPSSGLGVDGDFYIDTNTDTLYGPKASGAWPAGTSLVGPAGPAGPAGTNGWVPSAADRYQYSTGGGTAVEGDITAAGRALIDDADANTQLVTLGIGGAWAQTTPTPTAGSGSFTSASAVVNSITIGKTVLFAVSVTITTNGTAGSYVGVALPYTANGTFVFFGREDAVGGNILQAKLPSGGNTIYIYSSSNTYPGGNGYVLRVSGSYQRS